MLSAEVARRWGFTVLTIKAFSRITTIPETTLRYYEQMGLLTPAGRAPNGYRLYAASQVLPAKFLYSLRLASVPLEEVRSYEELPPPERQERLTAWHRDLGQRIEWLQMARKYVEGLMANVQEPVHLQITQTERVVWFTCEAQTGTFAGHFAACRKQLGSLPLGDEYFRWLCDLPEQPGWVRGQVGFRLLTDKAVVLPPGAELEERPAALALSLEHTGPFSRIPETYGRLFSFMQAHGWEAAGREAERYPASGGPHDCYCEIIVPILYLEGSALHD